MSMNVQDLFDTAELQRAGAPAVTGIPTGWDALDAALPGAGWPQGALTEVLTSGPAISGPRLLLPALARLSRNDRWIAWIDPPYIPYAPALTKAGVALSRVLVVRTRDRKNGLWAVDQALRSGTCGAVLAWPRRADAHSLRCLQLAAEQGGSLGFLFRPDEAVRQPSPAALRVRLEAAPGRHPVLRIIKSRYGRPGIELPLDEPILHTH